MTMRCTCGYTLFAERLGTTRAVVDRWALTAEGEAEGAGATPFGTAFGAGSDGDWGRYEVPLVSGAKEKYCQSCKRVRSSLRFTGITPIGSYLLGDYIYLVAGDAAAPATCFELRFTGPGGVYTAALAIWYEAAPPIYGEPAETATEPPEDAVTAVQLRARLPIVSDTGTYLVEVVDRCTRTTIPLVELVLEQEIGMQVLGPKDADLNGAPRLWLRGFNAVEPDAPQPAGAATQTIPFDKCIAVAEYDARFGTLPGDQGWTYVGTSTVDDYSLIDGGALRAELPSGDTSYWEQIISLDDFPPSLHAYMVTMRKSGSGRFDLLGYANIDNNDHFGVRMALSTDEAQAREITGGSGNTVLDAATPFGWHELGGSVEETGIEVAWINDQMRNVAIFGQLVAATATRMVARFGGLNSTEMNAYVRNVAVSVGGRYIRAGFTGIAITTAPTLRFYFSREARATTDLVARFRLRYGQGTNPYANPSTTALFSVPVPTANTLLEIPVGLSGLTAGAPFWFQVERAWDEGEDVFEGTVHLHNVTVRSL